MRRGKRKQQRVANIRDADPLEKAERAAKRAATQKRISLGKDRPPLVVRIPGCAVSSSFVNFWHLLHSHSSPAFLFAMIGFSRVN